MGDLSNGYAHKFLMPEKLALSATSGNIKKLEHTKTLGETFVLIRLHASVTAT